MKFRRKTITVDAAQWFPPEDPRHDAKAHPVGCDPGAVMVGTIVREPSWPPNQSGQRIWRMGRVVYSIKTSHGWKELSAGDWIITDGNGKVRTSDPNSFATDYAAFPTAEEIDPLSGRDFYRE